jgi:hypothetical protein
LSLRTYWQSGALNTGTLRPPTKHEATLRACNVMIAVALAVASCSKETEYTDRQRACIAKRYSKYDATKFDQCVDVCQQCLAGTTTTCTTSCKLKGAN